MICVSHEIDEVWRLRHLVPKMRKGQCTLPEVWFLQTHLEDLLRRHSEGDRSVDLSLWMLWCGGPTAFVPCGAWSPDQWLRMEIRPSVLPAARALLMLHARQGTLISRLPKHLVFDIIMRLALAEE